ncbi:MAG: DUF1194 domain-containing protein [Pseudomonadota bacterium]
MKRGRMKSLALAAALMATPTAACETALVLAIDISGSVDPEEYRLQMGGLAAALRDGAVIDALVAAQARVAVLQWSGSSRQRVVVPWTATLSDADVDRLATAVTEAPRAFRHYSTAIGEALRTAAELLGEIAGTCSRQVVDVSGDGFNNEGVAETRMRDALVRGGVVVNGLAIETSEPELTDYYRRNVIGGPGSFVMTAKTFEDYPEAIRRKLLRELTDKVVEAPRARSYE